MVVSHQNWAGLQRQVELLSFLEGMEKDAQWAWLGRLLGAAGRRGGGALARLSLPRAGGLLERAGARVVQSSPLHRYGPWALASARGAATRASLGVQRAALKAFQPIFPEQAGQALKRMPEIYQKTPFFGRIRPATPGRSLVATDPRQAGVWLPTDRTELARLARMPQGKAPAGLFARIGEAQKAVLGMGQGVHPQSIAGPLQIPSAPMSSAMKSRIAGPYVKVLDSPALPFTGRAGKGLVPPTGLSPAQESLWTQQVVREANIARNPDMARFYAPPSAPREAMLPPVPSPVPSAPPPAPIDPFGQTGAWSPLALGQTRASLLAPFPGGSGGVGSVPSAPLAPVPVV